VRVELYEDIFPGVNIDLKSSGLVQRAIQKREQALKPDGKGHQESPQFH
jgi:hypothetical protein